MTVEEILLRSDTAAQWTAVNPVLALREPGLELGTNRLKIGDGVTPWSGLPYATALPSDVTAAQTADQGYTDSKMAGEVTRADGKYVAASALDAAMAADVRPGGSATAAAIAADPALRAAYGRAAPVLSNFSYDPATGNLLSYQDDGITVTLTYNSDGTVATSKRGTDATQTYSYTGGNLVGVA